MFTHFMQNNQPVADVVAAASDRFVAALVDDRVDYDAAIVLLSANLPAFSTRFYLLMSMRKVRMADVHINAVMDDLIRAGIQSAIDALRIAAKLAAKPLVLQGAQNG